jgi:hypothetical protein
LTDSAKSKREYSAMLGNKKFEPAVISMEDFIQMNKEDYPELINYMGFLGDEDDAEMEGIDTEPIYQEHLSFEEMILGVKQGRFF